MRNQVLWSRESINQSINQSSLSLSLYKPEPRSVNHTRASFEIGWFICIVPRFRTLMMINQNIDYKKIKSFIRNDKKPRTELCIKTKQREIKELNKKWGTWERPTYVHGGIEISCSLPSLPRSVDRCRWQNLISTRPYEKLETREGCITSIDGRKKNGERRDCALWREQGHEIFSWFLLAHPEQIKIY